MNPLALLKRESIFTAPYDFAYNLRIKTLVMQEQVSCPKK